MQAARFSFPGDLDVKPISPGKLEELLDDARSQFWKVVCLTHSPLKAVVLTSSTRSQNEAFTSPVTEKNEIESKATTNLSEIQSVVTPEKDNSASFLSQNGLQDGSLTEEETRDLQKLSARSRQRYLKNLHILNEDSLFDEELSESVAHVDYFSKSEGEEDEGGAAYHPDESFYREALKQEPLQLKGSLSPEKEEVSSVEQTVESDGIPYLEDSIGW